MSKDVLGDAARAIAAHTDYGDPKENHKRIAALWQTYLDKRFPAITPLPLQPQDVAIMMILLKLSRLIESPNHYDSWVDIAGYAAIGKELGGNK